MTAAVGLPTLRLVRAAIGDWKVTDIAPGEHRIETVHLPEAGKPRSKRPAKKRPSYKSASHKRRS
jgi:23S rRNA pseudouridine2457 synthase